MTKPNATILDFSKAPEGVDWAVGLIPAPLSNPRYLADIGGVQYTGATAQEAFDKALAEYESRYGPRNAVTPNTPKGGQANGT